MPVSFAAAQKEQIAEEVAKAAITFAGAYHVTVTAHQQEKVTTALKMAVLTILERHEPIPAACPFKLPTPAGTESDAVPN